MAYSQDNFAIRPPLESDYDSPGPLSSRSAGKKKSALAKLAAHKSKNKVQPSDDSDLGSRVSLGTKRESFLSDVPDIDERNRSYPVDANVRVRNAAYLNEDSDEGIEVSSSGIHSRLSNGRSDLTPDLSSRNRNGLQPAVNQIGQSEFLRDSLRDDRGHDSYRPVPSARFSAGKNFQEHQSSSGEETTERTSVISRSNYEKSSTGFHSSHKDVTDNADVEAERSKPKSPSANKLIEAYENYLDENESKSSELVSDDDKLGALQAQRPSSSTQLSSRGSPQRSGRGHFPAMTDVGPHPALNSAHLKNEVSRPWSATLKSTQHFDTMSHHSFASTSVLPLISTKDAKSRSFLFGSTNSRFSLLGAEELERYFPDRRVRIFVCTWNMYEMKDPPKNIDNILLPDTVDYVQDFYVITSQESVRNREEWKLRLQECLGPSHVLFHFAEHGALVMAILIRRDLFWFCSQPEEGRVTTTPSLRTKGALAVSFTFFGTSFLFINSHFTAHDGRTKERIADYKKIIENLNLPKKWDQSSHSPSSKGTDVTSRFDCVFWSGDLNFRLDLSRDRVDNVVKGIQSKEFPNYEELVMNGDQLFRVQNEGLAFQQFHEGRIKFRPTYKHDVGTDRYDTSAKMRIPSYTDRILFRSKKKKVPTATLR